MRNRLLTLTIAGSLGLFAPAFAGWEEGIAAFKAGNYAQAAKEFEATVSDKPDWPTGHMMLGRAQLKLGKNQQAIASLRRAYDLSPGETSIQLALAQGYLEANMAGDAAKLLGQANLASYSKEQQTAHQKLYAMALDKSGQGDRAAQELAKAAAANPNDANLQFQYGAAALNAGNTPAAVAALEKAARLDPRDANKAKVYVQALIRSARESGGAAKDQAYTKAAEAARAMVAANPSFDNLLLQGETQLGAGQYDAAVATFGQASAKNANDWLPLYYAGQAHTAKGSYAPAIDALQKAAGKATKGEERTRVYKQLGFVY
ncbi:MAG: tetratricopeptide repeat protein, partial [Thermoanaerobaculia bacterium]|nr:tetratricopeptide repeat protein [Thermoanaerobaculia bacterium]